MTNTERYIEETATVAGWDYWEQVLVLARFIESRGLDQELREYAEDVAREEGGE